MLWFPVFLETLHELLSMLPKNLNRKLKYRCNQIQICWWEQNHILHLARFQIDATKIIFYIKLDSWAFYRFFRKCRSITELSKIHDIIRFPLWDPNLLHWEYNKLVPSFNIPNWNKKSIQWTPGSQIDRSNQKILFSKKWFLKK